MIPPLSFISTPSTNDSGKEPRQDRGQKEEQIQSNHCLHTIYTNAISQVHIREDFRAVGDGQRGAPTPTRRGIEGFQGRHGWKQLDQRESMHYSIPSGGGTLTPDRLNQTGKHYGEPNDYMGERRKWRGMGRGKSGKAMDAPRLWRGNFRRRSCRMTGPT